MSEDQKVPDAVMAPMSWKVGSNALERSNSLAHKAEQVLGLEPSRRAYVRLADDKNSHHFCSASPHDTLYFPKSHERSGQPRYRWEQQEDGAVYGYYVDPEAAECYRDKA